MSRDWSQGRLLHRPARTWPVPPPSESIKLAAPPAEPDPQSGGWLQSLLPMVGGLTIVGFAVISGRLVYLLIALFLIVALVGASVGTRVAQRRKDREKRSRTRQRYLEHAARAEREANSAAEIQRAGLEGRFPDTAGLLALVQEGSAVWERRMGDEDFGAVRMGLGDVPTSAPVVMDHEAGPLTAPEPELAEVADDVISRTATLPDAPVVLPLARLGTVAVVGDPAAARDLVGSWVASLAALHAPGELRIAGYVPPQAAGDWEWLKWLPHTRDPLGGEGFGRASRAVTTDLVAFAEQVDLVVGPRTEALQRAEESRGITRDLSDAIPGEHVVVVVDGYRPLSELGFVKDLDVLMERAATLKATVVVLAERPADVPASCGARVDLDGRGTAGYRESGPAGRVETGVRHDRVDRSAALLLARNLAPRRLAEGDAGADLADSVRALELLGYDNAERLDPGAEWRPPGDRPDPAADLLRVPIGMNAAGEPCELDLKEAAAGGMGPHGVLVGATGSGKSELLRSLAAALAIRHSPELLNFVLVDFKGGAAFAELADLPHTSGLITNLAEDLAMVDRMQQALSGELARRQELLRQAGNLDSLHAYHAAQERGAPLPGLPYLLVVVDEFSELLAARPEFLDTFIAIGRLGRSLGIHLLLASQRLDEGRMRGLQGHLRYRLCLRTFSAQESSAVLGSPIAYELPALPGVGYLKVDTDVSRFKAALVSLSHRPPAVESEERAAAHLLQPFSLAADRADQVGGSASDPGAGRDSELDVLVRRMAEAGSAAATHQVWLPPLPSTLTLGRLRDRETGAAGAARRRLAAAVGLVDRPGNQEQVPLTLDFSGSGGHLALAGAPRTGKSTFLRTLITALAGYNPPDEAQFYCIDLGGGALHPLSELPHVGAVVGRGEPETVGRLLREIRTLIDERAAAFRKEGVGTLAALREKAGPSGPGVSTAEVFLVVDNVGLLRSTFPELELEVGEIAASGLPYGVHIVLSAGRWMDIRANLLDAVGTRLELRLNDPVDSQCGRAIASAVPTDIPGRGLTRNGEQFQSALPALSTEPDRIQEDAELQDVIGDITRRAPGPRAPRIMPLPERLHVAEVPELAAAAGNPLHDPVTPGLLLGVEEFRSRPVRIDPLAKGAHLLVFGDGGSGRTTQLRRLLGHVCGVATPEQVRVHIADLGRGLVDYADAKHVDSYAFTVSGAADVATQLSGELANRLPPDTLTPSELLAGDWWSGPEHVLVVDDYDLALGPAGGPFSALVELLGMAGDIGFHIVLARKVAGAQRASFEPFGQRLREIGPAGLVLSGSPQEGPLLGQQGAQQQPPGRGYLVRRGRRTALVQCCLEADRQEEYA